MLGGLFFVPVVSLLGILIAWYRRDPRRFLDGPAEDAPLSNSASVPSSRRACDIRRPPAPCRAPPSAEEL
jgi:hypothetical protein